MTVMITGVTRGIFCAVLLGLLPACVSLPREEAGAALALQTPGLSHAERLLRQAGRMADGSDAAAVFRLRAAEIAWDELGGRSGAVENVESLPVAQQQALRILARSAEQLAPLFVGRGRDPQRIFTYAGLSYKVEAARDAAPTVYAPARLESVRPAREVPRKLVRNWFEETGAGAPLSPHWSQSRDRGIDRFVPTLGYIEPLTAVLAFSGPAKPRVPRLVTLTAYDPTAVSRVRLGKAEYPLAADFTAPIVDRTRDISEARLALSGLFRPDAGDASLVMLQPYDSQRIPVILVHGLNSHPRMWRNVVNDLNAAPRLRGRYQYWVFRYPSGWPISYSAMRLREELAALSLIIGPRRDMVFVGHSMGGLLSRMQVISPGRTLWAAILGDDANQVEARMPANHIVRRSLLFESNPQIGRVVFICVPHRGSGLADMSFAGAFSRLIRLPGRFVTALTDLPEAFIKNRPVTSIAGLSPGNPLFEALEQTPIQVPHHSIVGDRGRGDSPGSSDGVVPYSSAHLASAESELIVPGPHGSYDLPQTIDELKRILQLHLESTGTSRPAKAQSPPAPGR
jgi:pimeloyl-ACP methyl ester carboxylesterase